MTVQRTFEVWIEALENGCVIDFLSEDRFPEWIELASTELLSQELCPTNDSEVEDYRAKFSGEQVRLLAIRLFLSRETSLLEELQPLWRAFGAAPDDCSKMVSCAKLFSESWPARVVRVSPENRSTGMRFSRGMAMRTETSRTLVSAPFFEPIRQSRALNAKLHTGFPVVLGNRNPNLNSAVWITPIPDPKENRQIHSALQDHWKRLLSTIHQLIPGAPIPDDCTWALPSYLHQWANTKNGGVQTLESAELALAMQTHAELTEQTLRLGLGFSGRWDSNSQLRGVCGIGEKMKAAHRAGVSLLFICLDPAEEEPSPVPGLTVVVLPEYLFLSEVIRLVKSTNAHVTIIVDGLDEAENAIESKKALAWLQRFSRSATVFFGSQQLAFLGACEFTRLELPGVTTSSFEDANSLIALYADSFRNDCRRSDVVVALTDGRASELADKAGGNLWIITDFLESLLRNSKEPWPLDLDATILTDDVSKYCCKLMAQALSGYDDVPSRKAIQDFLQCLSFLGEGAWEINDVLSFAGIDRIGLNRELWRFSGAPTIARLIDVEGNKCRFWNRLTHEAVLGHFSCEEDWLLRRANEFLRGNSGGTVYDCVVEKFSGLIGRCAANSACALLEGSSWLRRRLELCLEHTGSIQGAIDELSSLHEKQESLETFGLLRLLGWLNVWRAAIERDDVPVQEWLSRAGDSTARFVKLTSPSHHGTKLLVPYMSAYEDSWPTSPEFAECVCEARFGRDWLLVFGDQRGGILVYRQVPVGYERFRSIRVRDGARVVSLAASNDSFVFALVTDDRQRYEIWKVNVITGAVSPFARVSCDGRIFATRTHEYLVFAPRQLGLQNAGGNEHLLKVFSSAGQELYEIPTGLLRSQNERGAVVISYMKNEIAVLATMEEGFRLTRFELQARGYTELETPNATRVNGAMADEAGRLIWADRNASGDTSFLNWTAGGSGTSGRNSTNKV